MRSLRGTLPWKIAYVANVVGRNAKTLFVDEGQIRSAWRFESVDGRGRPLPWLTFPAIRFVESLELASAAVLEFGSGASTEFWSSRAASVASVESDAGWAERVRGLHLPNATLAVEPDPGRYASAAHGFGRRFDVILVDGIERVACAEAALELVEDDGIVILDNADVHPDARAVLAADPRFIGIDFTGFGPINGYMHVTTVFASRATRLVR